MSYESVLRQLREEIDTYDLGGILNYYKSGIAYAIDCIERDYANDDLSKIKFFIIEKKLEAITKSKIGLVGMDKITHTKIDLYNEILSMIDKMEN